MKYTSKTATVLIYTIILVNVSLLMAIVILNNGSLLSSSKTTENIATKLVNNITDSSRINFKLHATLNSNGSGFVDTIGCPQDITLSGSTNLTSNTGSSLVFTGGILYCSGQHGGQEFKIYFNSEMSDIDLAEYDSNFVSLDKDNLDNTFSDTDVTTITLSGTGTYMGPDGFDDTMNSDNYSVSSTGAIYYNDGYIDDDADVRTTFYGYVSPDAGYVEILWSNEKTNTYITNNSNNDDNINARASTSSGYLYLDADKSFDIRIIDLDRSAYSNLNEVRTQNTINYSSASGALGYIQTDGTLSNSTGSGYVFDLPGDDYAVFLNNTGTGVLFYKLIGETLSGSGLYINPIIDDEPGMMRVLGNSIIINDQGRYIAKQSEIIFPK